MKVLSGTLPTALFVGFVFAGCTTVEWNVRRTDPLLTGTLACGDGTEQAEIWSSSSSTTGYDVEVTYSGNEGCEGSLHVTKATAGHGESDTQKVGSEPNPPTVALSNVFKVVFLCKGTAGALSGGSCSFAIKRIIRSVAGDRTIVTYKGGPSTPATFLVGSANCGAPAAEIWKTSDKESGVDPLPIHTSVRWGGTKNCKPEITTTDAHGKHQTVRFHGTEPAITTFPDVVSLSLVCKGTGSEQCDYQVVQEELPKP